VVSRLNWKRSIIFPSLKDGSEERVLNFMERSAIKLLNKRGNTNTEIAGALDRDMKTVNRALIEPADRKYNQPKRGSLVDGYEAKIRQWLAEGLPVTVMLQKAREHEAIPYQGGNTIFYQRVQLIRRELKIDSQKAIWRFEGLPGEYLQVDWGEKRNFPFQRIPQETRYCFVCRLKYSRFLYAEFHDNMRYETVIRCLVRCFENLGGIPWVLVFDNMSTVTTGRNEDGNPIGYPL
jgi:transposase